MKQVLLDTSFILTCVKQKIDFFEDISFLGLQIIIPKQVINELKKLKTQNSELAGKLLKKSKFKILEIGKGYADKSIIRFAKENPELIVATLDRDIKKKIKNLKLVIRRKKKIELV